MNHVEGAWPKDVDPNEHEQTARFRKKIEKDENFQESVKALAQTMEHIIRQNNVVNIYEDYFGDSVKFHPALPPDVKTINVFRDPNPLKRSVTYLCFMPDDGKKLAVSYAVLDFQKAPAGVSLDSYIWALDNPNTPDFTLSPSSPLVCLEFNPKDSHILFGGCYNGQVALWDTRKGARPLETSPIEKSHRDPCYRTRFLASKTGTDAFSCSSDGQVHFWDVRKLSEPTESLALEIPDGTVGAVSLEYESTLPTKFMVGTERGLVLSANRKAKNPSEKIANIFHAHHGPVVALERNPGNPKFFFTAGDWSLRIWSEDIREAPIIVSKYHEQYITDGCWSPVRPAVLFLSKADGTLDIWDFIVKTSGPVLTVKISDSPIQCVKVDSTGIYVACGSKDGSVTLLELNETLSIRTETEKPTLCAIFDREAAREKLLVSRKRELDVKLRAKSAAKRKENLKKEPHAGDPALDPDAEEDPLKIAEEAYFEHIEQEKAKRERELKKLADANAKTLADVAEEEEKSAEETTASADALPNETVTPEEPDTPEDPEHE